VDGTTFVYYLGCPGKLNTDFRYSISHPTVMFYQWLSL